MPRHIGWQAVRELRGRVRHARHVFRSPGDATGRGTGSRFGYKIQDTAPGDDGPRPELPFPDFAVEETDCPPELRAQDGHELAVLGDGFHASIEEDRLTALADDDRGLVYRDGSR
jgi:hypothetical protein